MIATRLNAALVALTSVGVALGVRLAGWPLMRVVVPHRADVHIAAGAALPATRSDSLVAVLVARDPFRVTRRPAPVIYDPVRLAQPATPPPPKPVLALAGIVWDGGRDPAALVEGFPGADGARALRRGDVIAGLRVQAIKPDRVVIAGLDTTWTLKVREPWR